MHDRSKAYNIISNYTQPESKEEQMTRKSPPETFKQAMNFCFSMRHLWDGSHSPISGSCKKSVEDVVLPSLSFGFCTGSSFPVLVPSMELSVLVFSAMTFLSPPSSCTFCCVLGSASPFCPVLPTPGSAIAVPLFFPAGRIPVVVS